MPDIHEQLASLRSQAETAERESIRLTAQAEEAVKARDAARDRLVELGCQTPEEARAEADKIETEVAAEIAKLTEALG